MTFQQLLYGAEILSQSGNPGVRGVEYDSRQVKPGDVFVAMRGETSDGNKYIDQAIAAGAVAVVTDSVAEKPREGVAWAQVPHGRRALARLSANFYRTSGGTARPHRNYRHERQEHNGVLARGDSGSRRSQERAGGDH